MTTVQNVGVVPPLPLVGESRQPLTLPGNRQSAQGSTTDQVRTQAAESARAAEAVRAQTARSSTRDEVKVETRQLATKAGLIQGTFDAFVDVVDPRYQTRIARIFGPDSAPAAGSAPNLVPSVVSKAYEAIDGSGKSGAFRQSA
ncbi:MAG: hypothetical protein JNN22_10440 [Rhodospirillales bacterium]|nr:hypothetical protein [Rhodospirillales bacterium]